MEACHPIPPPGATNSAGQTREAALEACHARCKAAAGCTAVNVVRATPPRATADRFGAAAAASMLNVPWSAGAGCVAASYAPGGPEPPDSSVCYGFVPAELDPGLPTEPFRVAADDPEDEVFYSTCYKKRRKPLDLGGPSPPPPAPPTTPAPWAFGDHCLSCEDAELARSTGFWQLAETCVLCSESSGIGGGGGGGGDGGGAAPSPPRQAVLRLAFSASGDVGDYDAPRRVAIQSVLAVEAGVARSAVTLEIAAASVSIQAAISLLADAAPTAADALSAGILASPAALTAALAREPAAAGIEVVAITAAPSVDATDSGDMDVTVIAVAVVVVGCALLALCLLYRRCRRRGRPTPPPPTSGEKARRSVHRKRYSEFNAQEMSGSQPPPPPPPPPASFAPLPHGWSEQIDEQHGIYYFNENTGESRWERPVADVVSSTSSPPPYSSK